MFPSISRTTVHNSHKIKSFFPVARVLRCIIGEPYWLHPMKCYYLFCSQQNQCYLHLHVRIHARTHTRTYAYTHVRIHARTHTRPRPRIWSLAYARAHMRGRWRGRGRWRFELTSTIFLTLVKILGYKIYDRLRYLKVYWLFRMNDIYHKTT